MPPTHISNCVQKLLAILSINCEVADTNMSQIFLTHVSLDVIKLARKDNDNKAANTNTNTFDPLFTWYFEVVVLDNNRKVARLGCPSAHYTPHWMHTLI